MFVLQLSFYLQFGFVFCKLERCGKLVVKTSPRHANPLVRFPVMPILGVEICFLKLRKTSHSLDANCLR